MTDRSSSTTGKVALVTGATSGIGRAAAISLVHCGYRIIVVGRDANRGVGVVDELERVGAGGAFLPCDLLDLADVRRLALEVTEHHRRLDVLLNNAGGTLRPHCRASLSPPSWRRASCKRRYPGIGAHPS